MASSKQRLACIRRGLYDDTASPGESLSLFGAVWEESAAPVGGHPSEPDSGALPYPLSKEKHASRKLQSFRQGHYWATGNSRRIKKPAQDNDGEKGLRSQGLHGEEAWDCSVQ